MNEFINYILVTIIVSAFLSASAYAWKQKSPTTSYPPTSLTVSPFLPKNVLLIFRSAVFLLFTCTQLYQTVYKGKPRSLFYYTTLNFILQSFYFGLVSYFSFFPTSSFKIHRFIRILFDIALSTSFLVCLVTWCILYPQSFDLGKDETAKYTNWISYLQHGINTLLLLVEFIGNSFTVTKEHVYLVPIWPVMFCIYAWVVHAIDDSWPYAFLRMDRIGTVFWYVGLLLVHVFFFTVAFGLSSLKKRFLLSEGGGNGEIVSTPNLVKSDSTYVNMV